MLRWLVAGVVVASSLCGCSGEPQLNCEASERYSGAGSIPPVRIPDDLSPPDESNSLRLPPSPIDQTGPSAVSRGCLETPPDYFDDRRLGDPEAGLPPGSNDEPAEPAADPAREISN
ncbi:MAG TPA: hypothetical protein VJA26_05825 [Gammaproteobacteria bacterium]|nr:hypothetical protein [Gammaproteobacteria bacterium]